MDSLTGFFLFAVILVLEFLAQQTWFQPYYRIGIPLLRVRSSVHPWPADLPRDGHAVAQALAPLFGSSPEHPTLHFKAFSPQYIAFRETLFENRGGFKYLPVIHSLIHLRPDGDSTTGGGTLTVSGYLNIYVIFILVYLIARIRTEPSFLFVAALLLIIFGLSFATQAALNRRIAGALSRE